MLLRQGSAQRRQPAAVRKTVDKNIGALPTPTQSASALSAAGQLQPAKMVVVIDHHAAHVFQDLNASRLQQEAAITPYDNHHFHHHLVHRKEAHYEGDRVSEENSFYKEIAEALVSANEIVLIGHGVGKSSAVDVLLDYLKAHRPDIAQRVQVVERADLSAL